MQLFPQSAFLVKRPPCVPQRCQAYCQLTDFVLAASFIYLERHKDGSFSLSCSQPKCHLLNDGSHECSIRVSLVTILLLFFFIDPVTIENNLTFVVSPTKYKNHENRNLFCLVHYGNYNTTY